MKKPKTQFSLLGYLLFFLMVCFVSTGAILGYSLLSQRFPDRLGLVAILTLFILLFLALVCTTIDIIRRKVMIEKPVKIILEATEKIKNGEFDISLKPIHPYEKYDEYDIIIENINSMTEELSKNAILKTDFIANISHEIKTPLTIIQNYALLLQNEKIDKDKKKEYTNTLVKASRKLSDLISNVLKLNKLENQKLDPNKTTFNVGEQLREIIIQYEELLEQRNIELELDIDDINVLTDEGLLEIIWSNLITNAIKYNKDNGLIKISLKQENKNLVMIISDTGLGMSEEIGKHIFEKFYQGDTSHLTSGNGLGLALVKQVIDILGGSINVKSTVDIGSTFTVLLKDIVYETI